MPEREEYDIVQLPKINIDTQDPKDLALAQAYRSFRLLSLRESPTAFASSYDLETQQPLEYFVKRLANPEAEYLVAIPKRPATAPSSHLPTNEQDRNLLDENDWAGLIVLIGPEEIFENDSSEIDPVPSSHRLVTGGPSKITQETTKRTDHDDNNTDMLTRSETTPVHWQFHLTGTYVHPRARGQGLGMKLMRSALTRARCRVEAAAAAGVRGWRCRVLVDTENRAASKLYQKAGFVQVGAERYTPLWAEAGDEGTVRERTASCLEFKDGR